MITGHTEIPWAPFVTLEKKLSLPGSAGELASPEFARSALGKRAIRVLVLTGKEA